jgi:hypothetical protein
VQVLVLEIATDLVRGETQTIDVVPVAEMTIFFSFFPHDFLGVVASTVFVFVKQTVTCFDAPSTASLPRSTRRKVEASSAPNAQRHNKGPRCLVGRDPTGSG